MTTPTYLSAQKLATEIGMNPNNIGKILRKWRHRTDHPPPNPDAYCSGKENRMMPLYLKDRLPEWHTWKTRRDQIVTETQQREREEADQREQETHAHAQH